MILSGMGQKWKPLAVFFSIAGLIGTLCIMQSNQFTEAITTVFFTPEQNTVTLRFIIGVIITVIVTQKDIKFNRNHRMTGKI